MNKEICCIFNFAPHYRISIYKEIDKVLKPDFYFGNKTKKPLKSFRCETLDGFKKILGNHFFGNIYWQSSALFLIFKPYKKYILTGDPYCLSNWFILFLSKIIDKETYLWTQGWYGDERGMKRLMKKLYFSLGTKILLYSNYSRELMLANGFDDGKLTVIYNSLDYDNQYEIRKSLAPSNVFRNYFGNDNPVVIYIGRIQKSKKIDLLVKSIASLNNCGVFVNLVIVGREIDNCHISELIESYELQNKVWLYGETYNEKEIGDLIFNSRLCVCPGAIGLTAIHSLTYGTPVITNDNFAGQGSEFEAIVTDETGDFFIEDDITDLTRKIRKWISFDPGDYNRIRFNCFKRIDETYNHHNQIQILSKALK